MTKPHVVVVGSANTDQVIRVNRMRRSGETVAGGGFQVVAGRGAEDFGTGQKCSLAGWLAGEREDCEAGL